MCGRFTVTAKNAKQIADHFQVELEKALERNSEGNAPAPTAERLKKVEGALGRFNVAPSQEVLTVRSSPDPEEAAQGEREARLMRWGLVPRWAKDLKVGYRMINAKAENLTSSRAYSPLVGKFRHRCLIVADGFYEFTTPETPRADKRKDRWRFTMAGRDWFAIAGLWRTTDVGEAFTMLTAEPGPDVAPYHNRQVAVLAHDRWNAWLDGSGRARDLLGPGTAGMLEVERVG